MSRDSASRAAGQRPASVLKRLLTLRVGVVETPQIAVAPELVLPGLKIFRRAFRDLRVGIGDIRRDRERGNQQPARIRVPAVRACDEGACEEAEQQVAGPAVQRIEHELRAGIGMQRVEAGPDQQVQEYENQQLVEAADKAVRR